MAFNFFQGKENLVTQLFKSEDFKKGNWEETGVLKSNSYVLVLYFSDKQGFNKFINSSHYKIFKKTKLKAVIFQSIILKLITLSKSIN